MLASLALAALATHDPGAVPRSAAPPFRLPSARELRWITKEEFSGQVLLLDIERTSCPRSAAVAPALVRLRGQYHSRGFEVLTVYDELAGSLDDPFARALTDANRKGFVHPVALNDGSEFHAGYYRHVQATPSAFLISRSGAVEFLGANPLEEPALGATRARIEALLAESAPPPEPPAPRAALAPFSFLLYSGGVVRSSDLTGRPTVLVAWAAGSSMARLAPAVERLQERVANRARVFGITFSDFDSTLTAAAACPRVALAVPDSRAHGALGASQLPQVVFVDGKGRVAARMTTFYGTYGIEGAVMERLTRCLLAEEGIDLGDGERTALVYDAKNDVSFVLPADFRAAAGKDADALEFVLAHAAEPRKPPTIRSRIASTETGDAAISRAKIAAASSHPGYKLESEEKLPNGGVLLSEQWQDGGRPIRAMRLFVNTPKGLLELDASGLMGDLNALWDQLRSAASSVIVGR